MRSSNMLDGRQCGFEVTVRIDLYSTALDRVKGIVFADSQLLFLIADSRDTSPQFGFMARRSAITLPPCSSLKM